MIKSLHLCAGSPCQDAKEARELAALCALLLLHNCLPLDGEVGPATWLVGWFGEWGLDAFAWCSRVTSAIFLCFCYSTKTRPALSMALCRCVA